MRDEKMRLGLAPLLWLKWWELILFEDWFTQFMSKLIANNENALHNDQNPHLEPVRPQWGMVRKKIWEKNSVKFMSCYVEATLHGSSTAGDLKTGLFL